SILLSQLAYVLPSTTVFRSTLPLSRFHFWGLGTRMMKLVMRRNRMPGVPELMDMAKDLGVQFIACTTTLGLMGITKDTLIDGIEDRKSTRLHSSHEWITYPV